MHIVFQGSAPTAVALQVSEALLDFLLADRTVEVEITRLRRSRNLRETAILVNIACLDPRRLKPAALVVCHELKMRPGTGGTRALLLVRVAQPAAGPAAIQLWKNLNLDASALTGTDHLKIVSAAEQVGKTVVCANHRPGIHGSLDVSPYDLDVNPYVSRVGPSRDTVNARSNVRRLER